MNKLAVEVQLNLPLGDMLKAAGSFVELRSPSPRLDLALDFTVFQGNSQLNVISALFGSPSLIIFPNPLRSRWSDMAGPIKKERPGQGLACCLQLSRPSRSPRCWDGFLDEQPRQVTDNSG